MSKERLLPIAAIEKLLKLSGADRVSESAAIALKAHLEKVAIEIGKKAIVYALHAGRKTIKDKDIELVLKEGNL